jgi:hypothetical protein
MIKSRENTIGAWASLAGVILAVIIGLSAKMLPIPVIVRYSTQMYALLLIIGLIVGYINSKARDTQIFLYSSAILIIVSRFGMDSVTGSLIGYPIAETIKTVFSALTTLFVPATIVVALKSIFSVSKI